MGMAERSDEGSGTDAASGELREGAEDAGGAGMGEEQQEGRGPVVAAADGEVQLVGGVADAAGRPGPAGTDAVSQQPGGDPHRDEEQDTCAADEAWDLPRGGERPFWRGGPRVSRGGMPTGRVASAWSA